MSDLGKRIEKVRKYVGMSMEEFGTVIGISRPSVSRLERGLNNPAPRTVMLIAEKFGVSEEWLKTGKGEMLIPEPDTNDLVSELAREYRLTDEDRLILKAFLNLSAADRKAFLRFGQELVKLQDAEELLHPWADIIPASIDIFKYLGRPSAGSGNDIFDEKEQIQIADTPLSRKADYVLQVDGESMEPEFHNGDNVLIKAGSDVEIGQVGVWRVGDEVYIKQRQPDRLHSLNPEFPDIPVDGEVHCYGLVIGKAEVL